MKYIPKNLSSKKFPNFIRNHQVLKGEIPIKSFPSIGLKNSSAAFKLSDVPNIEQIIIEYSAAAINSICHDLRSYDPMYENYETYQPKLIETIKKATVSITDNRVNVIANKDMVISGIVGNNSNLFNWIKSIPQKLTRGYGEANISKVCDESNRRINSLQSSPNLKISFSSSGSKGAWDLSTMAMRGISSCQRWNNNYSKALIGSIADPNTGIIFISNDTETNYGTKMIRRAVVRMVRDIRTSEQAILIERVYPHNYDVACLDTITFSIFANYISKKTRNQYPIVYGQELFNTGKTCDYQIPDFQKRRSLQEYELSYRDSKVIYSNDSSPRDHY